MTDAPSPPIREHLTKEIAGFVCLAVGIFIFLSLISFSNDDPSFNNNLAPEAVENYGGIVGAYLSDILFQLFGLVSFLLPALCLLWARQLLKFRDLRIRLYKSGASLSFALSLCGLIALRFAGVSYFGQTINEAGGGAGRILGEALAGALNLTGSTIVLLVCLLVSLMIATGFSLVLFLADLRARLAEILKGRREARAAAGTKEVQKKEKKIVKIDGPAEPKAPEELEPVPIILPPEPKLIQPPAKPKKKKKSAEPEQAQDAFEFLEPTGEYRKPSLSHLDHDGEAAKPIDREALTANARILENKLKDFNVHGEVVEVKPGPVVTMYEFAPAPGVKVNKIAGLSDDLSMALKALSIRIVAPIPGRGVVGIEIPNRDRETVYLKEIFESDEFQKSGGKLPMALGHDIFGRTVVSDLAKMPHLLVAGSTGSGKSVSINTMILSLLYRATPEDVRIIMVDPKMLELSIYEGIPHLLLPVVTDPKKAVLALGWAVREMERRYKLMSAKGVRNIDGYNHKIAKEEKEKEALRAQEKVVVDPVEPVEPDLDAEIPLFPSPEDEELDHGHLPYIVVIVDELADLMMVAGREIEESIARLAQMARAAGIHLILATQRPSVDVITGLIKANFPTRISFKVFSRTDSRTILDQMGAESLLGMGDMLFLPPGTGALHRVHGAFVSEVEVQRVVDFLQKQGDPEYDKSILEAPPVGEGGGFEEEDDGYDEKWDEALALVAETRMASISMIQRRLRIGYNRAARIIEKMEQESIIGPSDGTSRPREVFINNQQA